MPYGFFYTARPFTKILLVLFLMLTCYLILFGAGVLLSGPLFGIPVKEVVSLLEGRVPGNNIGMFKFLQVLYSIGLFLIPAMLTGFLIEKNTWEYLHGNHLLDISLLMLVIFLMFIAIPWINYLGYLNEQLSLPERWNGLMEKINRNDEESWELMKTYLAAESFWGLLFNIFMIALIPAVGEEFLFRGVLQRIFHEWFRNGHLAVWLAAILFSLAHFQFLGFIPRIILGALFGYMFLWSSNIWMPVIAHLINNSIGVIYYYLFLRQRLSTDPEQLGMQSHPILFIIGSVALTLAGLLLIRKLGRDSANSHLA